MNDFPPISDYRLIGDLYSAALVSSSGDIEWMCLPNFDSPAIFARLLDRSGGSFRVDSSGYESHSQYVPGTAIVETSFSNNHHEFLVRDFMLPQATAACTNHVLIRKLVGISDHETISLSFRPKPNYTRNSSNFSYDKAHKALTQTTDRGTLLLHLPDDTTVREAESGWELAVELDGNEEKSVVLEFVQKGSSSCYSEHDFEKETRNLWSNWSADAQYFDFCSEQMRRSAITLKLLQFYPTGALVAAPTTSLPETIGGTRNWDYRYVWVRDASYTLYSLDILGLTSEAKKFFEYIENIAFQEEEGGEKSVELGHLYTIHGTPVQPEEEVSQLSGYKNSRPVRVGNSASEQFQLDTYGTMIDSFYLAHREGVKINGRQEHIIIKLAEQIQKQWKKKDRGIWEVRNKPQHYTHSKVMCWVGINRVLRMQDLLDLPAKRVQKLEKLEQKISDWIWEHCFDENEVVITQHPETNAVDATTFLFPLVQFLDRQSDRTKAIIERTRERLCHKDLFVYRYQNDDGLAGQEGAFILATFWMISALAKIGKTEEAKQLFAKFDEQIADSGLIAEEINPANGEYLGNFPQAFSHMGYIMSAYYIDRYTE